MGTVYAHCRQTEEQSQEESRPTAQVGVLWRGAAVVCVEGSQGAKKYEWKDQ